MSDAETTAAAVKIQAIQRGKEDRAKVEQLKKDKVEQEAAAIKIQAIKRGNDARASDAVDPKKSDDAAAPMDAETTAAAVKIQAIQRGKEDRAKVDQMKKDKAAAGGGAAAAAADGGGEDAPKKKKKKKKKKRISIAVLGPTGSGKTTQAALIARQYDAVLVGTLTDILDWAVAEKKDCSEKIEEARAENRLVPDEICVQAVAERIALDDVRNAPGWVIENFPRNITQANELLELAGGKKSPITRFISLNASSEVLLANLAQRKPVEGKEEAAPAVPSVEEMGVLVTEYNTNLTGITKYCTDNADKKITFYEVKDVSSGSIDKIFQDIRTFLGPSAGEEEAAAKIQSIKRGNDERAEIKQREEAAIRIQAQIRGKEERAHAKRRLDIQAAHEEDEILSGLTNAATGPEGKKVQGIFPRNKKKDTTIALFIKKLGKIKTKDEKINILQELLSKKEKIVSLMSREFKRVNKKKEAVINYEEFESMVSEHGGKLEERKLINGKQQIEALQKEFDLRPGAFKELFDDMDADDSGGVDLDEFRDAFAERAELWGYGEAFSSARTKELGLFEAIDVDKDSSISWVEFERYLTNEKNKKQKIAAAAAAAAEEKAKAIDQAKKQKEIDDTNAKVDEHFEDDDECELENLKMKLSTKNQNADAINGGAITENVRRRRNPKSVQVSDSVAQQRPNNNRRTQQQSSNQMSSSRTQGSSSNSPPLPSMSVPQDERPPMGTPDRKIMLVKILRKYRKGLHTTFEFYSKANIGSVKQFTFDQMREEHSGVNLLMFRRMCNDFALTHNPRAKFDPKSKAIEEMIRPYITKEEIDAIFRRHAQHLKRVSSISHGKGILNEAQYAAAFAQIAVVLLREDPWCDRYPEEWRRVDAIFSRLDVNNNVLLRKRLRGFGGFSVGNGDIQDRKGGRPTVYKPKGFSFNLRLPGDPVTPPPDSTRPRRRMRDSNGNTQSSSSMMNDGPDQQRMAQQAADNDDTKMTVSLAAEFGIDDMSGSGNNPYGTTSSAQYGDVTSMLDNLGLTYGLDSSRLGGNGGGNENMNWGEMESMSWGELDGGKTGGDSKSGRGRGRKGGPQRPNGEKTRKSNESPRQRRR